MKKTSAVQKAGAFNETKMKVLLAASGVFSESGYKYGTVREIADRAGVNVAAINYYFGNKEELYLFVIQYWLEMVFRDFPYEELADRAVPADERFAGFIRATVGRLFGGAGPAPFSRLFAREAVIEQTGAFEELIREAVQPNTRLLRGIIADMAGQTMDDQALDFCTTSTIGLCLFYHLNQDVLAPVFGIRVEEGADVDTLAQGIIRYAGGAIAQWGAPRG